MEILKEINEISDKIKFLGLYEKIVYTFTITLSLIFFYGILESDISSNINSLYILSSISQGLAALFAIVVSAAFIYSQNIQSSGKIDISKPITMTS